MESIFRAMSKSELAPIHGAMLRALNEHGQLSVPALRSLSPLSDKAQVLVDRAVVEVGLERLQFAADVMADGLVYDLPDPLSVTQLEWDQESKAGGAVRTMSPAQRQESQALDRKHQRLPIYLTMEGFTLDIRTLKMSERVGAPLDVSIIKQATRRVNEAIEDAAINGTTTTDGSTFQVSGPTTSTLYTCPGLLNNGGGLPSGAVVNTAATSTDWSTQGTIGTQGPAMLNDVLAAILSLQQARKYGPYRLVVGTKAGLVLNNDFKTYATETIRERLESIDAGGGKLEITIADRMPDGGTSGQVQFALVQMTNDVVEMVQGQQPTVIPWTSLDGFTLHWVVMAIMIQRVRCDYNGNFGVYTGTKT
jgi:uncharacterized linocin/CFP29 family protein